jgi:hypothetical protein
MKKMVVFLLVCFLLPNLAVASNGSYDVASVVVDTVLVRPVGLAFIAVGTGLFIVSLPFSAISGSVKGTADTLVGTPYRYTFTRPIGDFGPSWGVADYAYYPYYPYYSTGVIQQQPQKSIYQAPQHEQQSYWFCPDPEGYYPRVKKCPKGWRKVPSTPADLGAESPAYYPAQPPPPSSQ